MTITQGYLENPVFKLVSETAGELGVRAFVIGGYVRDCFLGRPNKDIDIVVEMPGQAGNDGGVSNNGQAGHDGEVCNDGKVGQGGEASHDGKVGHDGGVSNNGEAGNAGEVGHDGKDEMR